MSGFVARGTIETVREKGKRERWWIKVVGADAKAICTALGIKKGVLAETETVISNVTYTTSVRKARDYVWFEKLRDRNDDIVYMRDELIRFGFAVKDNVQLFVRKNSITLSK